MSGHHLCVRGSGAVALAAALALARRGHAVALQAELSAPRQDLRTYALTNATLPYVITVAQKGPRDAVTTDEAIAHGLNVANGVVTNEPVAEALGLAHVAPAEAVR